MKRSFFLMAIVALTMMTGCFNQRSSGEKEFSYTINEEEDVINSHGMIVRNLDKLDAFMDTKSGIQRVVHYTIEGDPIFNDLIYTDNKIEMRYDTSKDKFGTPQVITHSCSELTRSETDTLLDYTLTGCEGEREEIEILQIPFDVEQQDRFEFSLKYGVNQKNEINTLDKKLVKDLQNGETVEVSDFELPVDTRQQIYKRMVLANYLDEKKLSTECNQKPYESYDLIVKINGGDRHYQWSECDNSKDGQEMTRLANAIIDMVQAGDVYKELPEVKGYYQ